MSIEERVRELLDLINRVVWVGTPNNLAVIEDEIRRHLQAASEQRS